LNDLSNAAFTGVRRFSKKIRDDFPPGGANISRAQFSVENPRKH
jgi:hypothetical protein